LHDYKKAIDAFEKAIRYQREFPSALKNMGFAYEQMGDMDNALTRYLQALELSKGDAGLYVNIANAYVAWKNYDEAKTYYLQSVKLSPKEIAGWMGLRHIALLKGDIDSYAKSTMAVVSRLSPETVAESLMVLREVNHWSEADELLCKADSMDATSDELDAERLLAYQRTDSYPGKIIALVKRLKSLPSPSDHTLSCLARYAFDIKDFAAAQGYLEKVKTPSIRTMRLLWQTSIAQKEWDKTQKLILPYLEDNDNRSDALFFLAKIKAANHDLNAAREFLIKALEAGFSELELLEGDPGLKKVFEELRAKKGTE
jgi:tetratricopeptide (TPR) repeat protein